MAMYKLTESERRLQMEHKLQYASRMWIVDDNKIQLVEYLAELELWMLRATGAEKREFCERRMAMCKLHPQEKEIMDAGMAEVGGEEIAKADEPQEEGKGRP